MTSDAISDLALWDQAGAGAGHAFGQLFDRHSRAVYNHCFRLTASWATAEDLVSDTFLQAWRHRASMRPAGDSLRPWLLAVATNVARADRRSVRRRLALVERAPVGRPAADHADDVAERVDSERRMAAILAEVRRLPRAEQEAVVLCLWAEVSYADAAVALGIAEVSVRSRVSRARSKLRVALAPVGTEDGLGTDPPAGPTGPADTPATGSTSSARSTSSAGSFSSAGPFAPVQETP